MMTPARSDSPTIRSTLSTRRPRVKKLLVLAMMPFLSAQQAAHIELGMRVRLVPKQADHTPLFVFEHELNRIHAAVQRIARRAVAARFVQAPHLSHVAETFYPARQLEFVEARVRTGVEHAAHHLQKPRPI